MMLDSPPSLGTHFGDRVTVVSTRKFKCDFFFSISKEIAVHES